jgi:hypothetical protein
MSNLRMRVPVPFPANVAGQGGLTVEKVDGVWIVRPAFDDLASIAGSAVANPAGKDIWIWDPVTDDYNVLTLNGLAVALYTATSTTSFAIGAGSKTFATQKGKDYRVGDVLRVTSDANPMLDYMVGTVAAYGDASLTVNVTTIGGSGSHADWTIRPTGFGPAGASYAATSTTSLAIGTGSKVFATQGGLAYVTGSRVRAASNASPAVNWMEGVVTAYSGTSLTVTIDKIAGAGTLADWNLSIAGQPGAGDLLSTNNLSDVANTTAALNNLGVRPRLAPHMHSQLGGL